MTKTTRIRDLSKSGITSDHCGHGYRSRLVIFVIILLLGCGCAKRPSIITPGTGSGRRITAPAMGYSVQVGAFSRVDNAVRFTRTLEDNGVQAFYFRHASGLYKVRFGNYSSRPRAVAAADNLKRKSLIDDFMIVGPKGYASARGHVPYKSVREDLVQTARGFIGLPYKWGSANPDRGLDCSGLVLAVYRLNGIDIPRSSRQQYRSGRPINKNRLERGDLVFFNTSGGGGISHVGIYIGNNRFIHAPGRGKTIGIESLSKTYFRKHYKGACTYL